MKRLCIIRISYFALNIDNYNVQEIGLAKGLLNFGISTDIYSKFNNLNEEIVYYRQLDNHIKLIPIKGISLFNNITYYPNILNKIINGNYDVIQIHEDSQLMTPIVLRAAHNAGIKTVLFQGMYTPYTGIKRVLQILFNTIFDNTTRNNCDFVFAKTEMAKKYLDGKKLYGANVLPVGLDFDTEKQVFKGQDILNNFKSQHNKLLLYIGKIEERRNPFFIVDLIYSLRNNKKINIGIVIVGNGPLGTKMKEYVNHKGLKNNFLFLENVPNVQIHAIYRSCDVFILPTNNEIYGMVIMEALLNGVPVISTPEAGPLSILKEKVLGCCLPLNLNNWNNEIREYLYLDTQDTQKEYRRNYILNNYNWVDIAKRYIKIIT
jgi:glycosyltransferase involved in cell wall biosynthesis